MIRKIKDRQGGAALFIVMISFLTLVVFLIPGILNTSSHHLVSKKVKIHLNSMAKSGAIRLIDWDQTTQTYVKNDDNAINATVDVANSIFNASGANNFTMITDVTNASAKYRSKSFRNANGRMAYQVIVFEKDAPGLRPSVLEISDVIWRDSNGQEVPGWKDIITIGQIDIKYPTVVVVMRYEIYDELNRTSSSLIRISSSQNKNEN